VLFTSGSTGPAKGVVYTHRRLAAMRDAVAVTYGVGPGSALVAAFAPFALLGPALGASSATPQMDVTRPSTLRATALAEAVRAVDAAVVFASPAALTSVVRTQDALSDRDRAALAQVRLFLSAGAPVRPDLLEAAGELMPRAQAHTPYGMTEQLPVTDVTLAQIRAAGPGAGVLVGHPVAGSRTAVSALDADGSATGAPSAAPDVTGEVLVAGPHRKERYDRLWATEADAARDVPWHRTGDVGHLDEQGRLWVEGRLAHVVHTERGPVTPVGPEQTVETVEGVGAACVVGVGPHGAQRVVVVVQPVAVPGTRARRGTAVLAEPALAARVRAALVPLDVAAVLATPRLPTDVRHQAKIDRTRVAAWAATVLSGGRARL